MGDDAWGEGEWLVVALHANRVMTYINVINNIILKNCRFPWSSAFDQLCRKLIWFNYRFLLRAVYMQLEPVCQGNFI